MATQDTLYRLSQAAPSADQTVTCYVGGYTENADGNIGYHWTSNIRAASKLSREVASAAAGKVEQEQAAYRATHGHGPAQPIIMRAVAGGLPVERQ